jgi:coenzyme F420-0:L-glutamate ligase/coenzyme F420-1:gamma-L-glutamate ligase
VQCILDESIAVSRVKAEVLITRHRLGFISANAAVDTSNVGEDEAVLLLPENPAESAEVIYEALAQALGFGVPVIISDSHGRPFRYGTVGVALACFGLDALRDYRGTRDLDDRELETTEVALADQLATAADLVAGQGGEGTPVTWFQGITADSGLHDRANAKDTVESLLRDPEKDLYA